MITIKRYDADTFELIGSIDNKLKSPPVSEHKLYGGCLTCTLNFVAKWAEGPVTNVGEELVVVNDEVPVFAGRVLSVQPSLDESVQTVQLDGWWRRMDEIECVTPALNDQLMFGQHELSDHPSIVTAFGIVDWLIDNLIITDTKSPITRGEVYSPEFPCKLAGPFSIHASDRLATVLETLATMEDCVVGIDAERKFYYIPRQRIEGHALPEKAVKDETVLTVRVAEDVPANWKTQELVIGNGGSFIYDRRGPNTLSISSRDALFEEGIRTYRNLNALPATRRLATWRAMNIKTGVQGRRLARGLFRRFSNYSLKIENLYFISGPRRFEPHLGMYRVTNDGEEVALDLAGSVTVEWDDSIKGTITLGENKPEPGSGNSINDPFEPEPPPDDAQIDTGIGNDDYPWPSGDIDFDDDFDGDGDDFHQGEREFPTDGEGEVDYGDDTNSSKNKPGNPSAGGSGSVWPAIITVSSHPVYNVNVLKKNLSSVHKAETGIVCWPPAIVPLPVGTKVEVYYHPEQPTSKPIIDGSVSALLLGNDGCCNGAIAE